MILLIFIGVMLFIEKVVMSGSKPVVFIGSSSNNVDIIEELGVSLERCADVHLWTQINFELSRSLLDSLEKELELADFGVFLLAPDDRANIQGTDFAVTRDNVLIELGLSFGKLGRDRTIIVQAVETKNILRIPSDLLGVTPVLYSHSKFDVSKGNGGVVLSTASSEIKKVIQRLGVRDTLIYSPTAGPKPPDLRTSAH